MPSRSRQVYRASMNTHARSRPKDFATRGSSATRYHRRASTPLTRVLSARVPDDRAARSIARPHYRNSRGSSRACVVAGRFAGLARASETLMERFRLCAARWRERTRRASAGTARTRLNRVTPQSRHRDTRKPRQPDRIGAARIMPNVDYIFWESIPMPALFTLIRNVDRWAVSAEEKPSTK